MKRHFKKERPELPASPHPSFFPRTLNSIVFSFSAVTSIISKNVVCTGTAIS